MFMSLLVFPRKLPFPVRVSDRRITNVQLEEFSVSPVDEVHRAIVASLENRRPKIALLERLVFKQPPSVAAPERVRLVSAMLKNWQTWSDEFPAVVVAFDDSIEESEEESEKHDLGLGGDFSPSRRLTEIWISGLLELGEEAGRSAALGSEFEVAQEFARTLSTVFGTTAQQLRYRDGSIRSITRNSKFTPTYQIALCDAFLIIPDQSPDFLVLLLTEITAALHVGCRIGGDWGQIVVSRDGRDLQFALNSPVFESDPNFEDSVEVE
jgi:hypothetical protein